ncbi:hypothetical protein BC938DRAFT_482367 [Jimgerdemannia flammicorona]|uniref:Uncharacterized protein n=1 Tax=Jimgerdemannia flammicorona TaxID=994334 RepID=A0A433QWI4_9FUNG|nr:hypothetical protein BC938DRAFT_482367 [Jimgerdemannia flammicorona]
MPTAPRCWHDNFLATRVILTEVSSTCAASWGGRDHRNRVAVPASPSRRSSFSRASRASIRSDDHPTPVFPSRHSSSSRSSRASIRSDDHPPIHRRLGLSSPPAHDFLSSIAFPSEPPPPPPLRRAPPTGHPPSATDLPRGLSPRRRRGCSC